MATDFLPSSPIVISASVYCNPFCNMLSNAAGGTNAPLILLCDICDSIPNVYAEWWKPEKENDTYSVFCSKFTPFLIAETCFNNIITVDVKQCKTLVSNKYIQNVILLILFFWVSHSYRKINSKEQYIKHLSCKTEC